MSEIVVALRPLESDLFQVSIASVNVSIAADVDTAFAQARTDNADLLVVRVPAHRVDAIQHLESSGAQLCDVLVTYTTSLPLRVTDGNSEIAYFRIRDATAADSARLHDIACRAFDDFPGHWHMDRRFDRSDANKLYGRWIADLARNVSPASPVLVLESEEGTLAAFLALAHDGAGNWSVPLTAVDPKFRGQGLLRRALVYAAKRVGDAGAVQFTYETQLTNWAACRVVSSLGFTPSSARLTFHLWKNRS